MNKIITKNAKNIDWSPKSTREAESNTIAIDAGVKREFEVSKPNEWWVSDITYSVPGVQGKQGCLNEPRVYLEFISDQQELVCL